MEAAIKLNVQLLGPLSIRVNDQTVTPSATKQRKIIALLALNAGRVVTVPTLTDELWAGDPPATTVTTLQTYIVQLRKRLASALPAPANARAFISTHHGGYLLQEELCQTDIAEFDAIARRGRAAAEAGDYRAASELLSSALDLWRGPVFADIPTGRALEIEAISLEERRLGILERRIEADLVLNRHSDLLGELRLLTAKHPLNENLSGLMMIALYRSGYAARALEEFQRLRAVLRGDLGIEPSSKLDQLQKAILARDPALEAEDQFTLASICRRPPPASPVNCGNTRSGGHLIDARPAGTFPRARGATGRAPVPGLNN
jgi:DNA-binding SARP family transcriptional activator